EVTAERVLLHRLVVVDDHEQAEDRARRERQVLPLVEPERAARVADVDRRDGAVVPLELLPRHREATARAVHGGAIGGHGKLPRGGGEAGGAPARGQILLARSGFAWHRPQTRGAEADALGSAPAARGVAWLIACPIACPIAMPAPTPTPAPAAPP